MVLNISGAEFVRMKMVALDRDEKEAPGIFRALVKRLQQQENPGFKSHLE